MISSQIKHITLVLFVSSVTPGLAAPDDVRPAKPNVVLILADDLGWQDVKCYDIDAPSPYETPNIDALAKKGVMFRQAYSPAPTCAPTRCAIMSGNHPARAQKTHVVGGAPPAPLRKKESPMMDPWYSGRMPADEFTLAKALKQNGYTTGHSGKWHIAINHNAFPQPKDVGFDWTRADRGVTGGSRTNRLTDFATDEAGDPYRLDAMGIPYDQTTADALTFLRENNGKPFFLYFATWLVHAPIHTRSKELLEKYCGKLGVDYPTDPTKWELEGQKNPYYCAMVEMLDSYVGSVIHYLESTDDPRWPGHKLSENTYLIFTSDNGGMERHPGEIITDNVPLDRGKISAMEGGTRVPLIITGPGIPRGVQSDVMVNGLDFYPTILSWTGSSKPASKHLDGADLSTLLTKSPTDPALVKDEGGAPRDTMVWHFPHGAALESTIRIGGYKLVRNYNHRHDPKSPELELFQLYRDDKGSQTRVDIEESRNLAKEQPERTEAMNQRLTEILTEMKASLPYYNPHFKNASADGKKVPTILSSELKGQTASISYRENGAKVVHADLIYTLNGGSRYEEWFRAPATLSADHKVSAVLPKGCTHYYLNLIDENNFLVSDPEAPDALDTTKAKVQPSERAHAVPQMKNGR